MRIQTLLTALLSTTVMCAVTPVMAATAQGTDSSASSTGPIEVVVVTAEKRAENIQDIPTSISAYSGDQLRDRGILHLEDLKQVTPDFELGSDRGASNNVVIRGIGGFAGEEPAVAQVQDGVPYTTSGWGNLGGLGTVSFMDAERVEVLRGPQGTLGGRNATAGGVYVTSKRPTDDFEGYIQGTVGNYDRVAVEGAVSGPILGDLLEARAAFHADRASGWIDNTALNQKLDGINETEGRLSLLSKPTDNFSALLILEADQNKARPVAVAYGRLRSDQPSIYEVLGAPTFDPQTDTVQFDQQTYTNQKRAQATLHLDWDVGFAKLSAITGFVFRQVTDIYDDDGSTIPTQVVGPGPFKSHAWQWTQEVTATADLTDRIDLVAGALYATNRRYTEAHLGLPYLGLPAGSLFINDIKSLESIGVYAQARWRITDELRLTLGDRYIEDDKRGAGVENVFNGAVVLTAPNHHKWDGQTPRASLDWKPSDDLTLYVTAARGYKSGGFEMATFPAHTFNPESVWNYEVGAKFTALDQRVHGSVSVFDMDYTNLQQTIGGLQPGVISFLTINASKAVIRGVESSVDAEIIDRLHVSAAGAYLDAHYEDLSSFDPLYPELGTPGSAGLNVRNLSGNQLEGAPTWQLNIAGDYTAPLTETYEGVLRAAYSWQSKVFGDIYNHPGTTINAYGLINASVSVRTTDGEWELTAFAENLADTFYLLGRGGGATYTPGLNSSLIVPGDPRRYGIQLERRF